MKRFQQERFTIIVTSLCILLPMVLGLLLWNQLPSQIPIHFNIHGQADGYSSKAFAVFGLPLFLLATHAIAIFATLSDPKNRRVSDKIFHLILWIIPLVSFYVSVLTYGKALGYQFDVTRLSMYLVAIIFIIIGNYLPKTKQNYTVGIKCKWTLDDVENWDHTHRFGGYVMVIAGILIFVLSFLPNPIMVTGLLLILVLSVLLPFLYSFNFYRKKTTQN